MAIASLYRRDWKNARASLVDAWRLIHFNANDLQSAVDIVFDGDIGSTTADPFPMVLEMRSPSAPSVAIPPKFSSE